MGIYKSVISLTLFLFSFMLGYSQATFSNFECEVKIDNKVLKHPFTGGFNSPQFNNIDLNLDGVDDLLVFDRIGGVLMPFLHNGEIGGTDYTFAPEYRHMFGKVQHWILLRDFNNDGILDMFTAPVEMSLPGIEVRRGKIENGKWSFDLFEFDMEIFPYNALTYPIANGYANIYVPSPDKIDIDDIDGDGDLDVLSFETGGAEIFFYRNLVVEEGIGLDSFKFEVYDPCWGKVREAPFSSELTLSDDPNNCAEFFNNETPIDFRHAGSTITILDTDYDGSKEIILGDLANHNVSLLKNSGTPLNAWITDQDNTYPSYDVPLEQSFFNAAFYVDVNNDQERDVIFSPNAKSTINNYNNARYYENVKDPNGLILEHRTDAFLNNESLDFGTYSSPYFFDYNFDGLIDLMVGTEGRFTDTPEKDARIYLFENKGTLEMPSFELIDDDYAGFSQFSETSWNYAPTLGDLDTDGDLDLIVGDNAGKLFYCENIAEPNAPAVYANAIYNYEDIDVGDKSKPFLFDFNEDGLLDLIVGERNANVLDGILGSINYYENKGSADQANFVDSLSNPVFGAVNTKVVNFVSANSAPIILDVGNDFMMITGSEGGNIMVYDDIKGNLEGTFNQVAVQWGNMLDGLDMTPSMADIDNDDKYEIVCGNFRGGLSFYNTPLTLDGDMVNTKDIREIEFNISPNPVRDYLRVQAGKSLINEKYEILNFQGRVVTQGSILNDNVDVRQLNPGMYLLRIRSFGVHKFVKL